MCVPLGFYSLPLSDPKGAGLQATHQLNPALLLMRIFSRLCLPKIIIIGLLMTEAWVRLAYSPFVIAASPPDKFVLNTCDKHNVNMQIV